jgi:ribosomal protein S12 methylthiotransferase
MKRPWDGERYLKVFSNVRKAMPECSIRTTFIVGFPGETEAEFQYMLDFAAEARLDRVGAFVFSREPGTPAYDMAGQVLAKTKKARFDRIMTQQQEISLAINKNWLGKEIAVLIEDVREGWRIGRSHRDAPEIDGLVFLRGTGTPGQIVKAKVTDAEPYDLYGHAVRAGSAGRDASMKPLRQASPAQRL